MTPAQLYCNQHIQYILGMLESSFPSVGINEVILFDKDNVILEVKSLGIALIPAMVKRKTIVGEREFPCFTVCQEYYVPSTSEEPEDGGYVEVCSTGNPLEAAEMFCKEILLARNKKHFEGVREDAAAYEWEQGAM